MQNEDGASELVDETLLLALIVICAGIAGVIFLGFVLPVQKTAYLVPEFGTELSGSHTVIRVYDRAGDTVTLNESSPAPYPVAFFVDTARGSFRAVREETLSTLHPGQTVYLYFDGRDFVITDDLTGSPVQDLPDGGIIVRIVDTRANILIAKGILVEGPVTTATVAVTPAPTANVTATTTVITTATISATPTTTATTSPTPPVSYGITVSWSPTGLGSASISPPAVLTNYQTISTTQGSSLTVYFIPQSHAGKAVKKIQLDGVTVYSGSATNTTISYTVTNIQSLRSLTATFG